MNIQSIRAGQAVPARAPAGLLQRIARWLNGSPDARTTRVEEDSQPATWPECGGHPYVIGPGTLLVLTYMRKRMR